MANSFHIERSNDMVASRRREMRLVEVKIYLQTAADRQDDKKKAIIVFMQLKPKWAAYNLNLYGQPLQA
jgi:hypothetical protein